MSVNTQTDITEVLTPAQALKLSELRQTAKLYNDAKNYRAAVSAFNAGVGDADALYFEIAQVRGESIAKLAAAGLSDEDAELYFRANLLVEGNPQSHKQYELLKVEAQHGEEVRRALETALTSKDRGLATAHQEYETLQVALLESTLSDVYSVRDAQERLGSALRDVLAKSPAVGEKADAISIATLAHIAVLDRAASQEKSKGI
jgi:hypothetical protein